MVSGSVWLCPELIYCHTLEVAKDHPRSSLEEAAGSSDCGSGRRELWPSPLARAEHPAKPGLTPAWGGAWGGWLSSRHVQPMPCHLPARHGSPGLAKTGASLRDSLATNRLGFGCNLVCLYHPWEPQGGFEDEFISSVWAEVLLPLCSSL